MSLIVAFFLVWISSHINASTTILTSDVGGNNASLVICPNELVTLSCQTFSSALAWFNDGVTSKIYVQTDNINVSTIEPIDQGVLDFKLTEIIGNNLTSVVIVNVTDDVTVGCNHDGSSMNISDITILIKELAPPPANYNVTDVQIDRITLTWNAVLSADSYEITISPQPNDGQCQSGICVFSDTNATIDQLELGSYTISISSVNCAGSGNGVTFDQDTIPTAIIDTDFDEDNGVIMICPNEPVNITCQTKNALVWLLQNSGDMKTLKVYNGQSSPNQPDAVDNFVITLLENDGVNFTSLLEAETDSSFNISCSPTGGANDIDNNANIIVSVIGVLTQPNDVTTTKICYDYIELYWTQDLSADDYYITVTPPPSSGMCINGICDGVGVVCNDSDKCSIVVNDLKPNQYTFSVSSINCAGNSQPATLTRTIVPKAPSEPAITSLSIISNDNNDNNMITVLMKWNPPVDDCLTPSIDNYTITITSYGDPVFMTALCCNHTLQLEQCGLYSFTIEAVNSAGTGPKSLSKPLSSGELSQSISLSLVQDDSVVLFVSVTECLIPALVNITMELSSQTALRIRIISFNYQSTNSTNANLIISDLSADTDYNTTVTVFYEEFGVLRSLQSQMLQFRTSQNFLSLQNIAIGSLTAGFVVGSVIFIIILIIGIFCVRAGYKKRLQRVQRKQEEMKSKNLEIQQNIESIKQNQAEIIQMNTRRPYAEYEEPTANATPVVQYADIKQTEHLYPPINGTFM